MVFLTQKLAVIHTLSRDYCNFLKFQPFHKGRSIMRKQCFSVLQNKRGAVLTFTLVMAFLFAVAAYADIMMALSQAEQARFFKERPAARYASESGVVWAMQRLWQDPTWSSAAGNVDFTMPDGTPVDVIIPPCVNNPCEDRAIQAKVAY